MIDTKIVLALALLLGTILAGPDRPPAGGVPIPQHGGGISNAQ
jgi:hypothetical protein